MPAQGRRNAPSSSQPTGDRPISGGRADDGVARNRVLTVVAVVVAIGLAVGLYLWTRPAGPSTTGQPAVPSGTRAGQVVRDSSHRLSTATDGKVTFVEFLDFECEGCRAAYPVVEQLRQTYSDRVTFVIRYFPLPGHLNSERAARAVEAAARQGKLEPMYQTMYETQQQWGEQKTPADPAFRQMAAGLELDMARWDTDYASPEVAARVKLDLDDATALGLSGTPSFFVNGQPLEPESVDDMTRALDQALAQ